MSDSLRIRKKAETKLAISTVAESLFIKNGYQHTTLSDIADAANVSQRTIFSYFPSKESIIFHEYEDKMAEIIDYLNENKAGDILTSLVTFRDADTQTPPPQKVEAARRALVKDNKELHDYFSSLLMNLETKFVELLANERGISPDSIQAHMVAAVLRSSFNFAEEHGHDDHEKTHEAVLKFIDAGLRASITAS